jgi:hypothetical protein
MRQFFALSVAVLLSAAPALGAVVWTATFDVDADGVVDVFDQNLNKVMIGAVAGGKLTITTQDEDPTLSPPASYPYTPDKAGRPLGSTVTAADAFSARYRFVWSDLYGDPVQQDASNNYEFVGFLGDSAGPQTRQVVGAVLRHWQIANGDYYIRLGTIVGDSGDAQINHNMEPSINLGPAAEGADYELAVGWDPATTTVSVILYNGNHGGVIYSVSNVITEAVALDNLALTHLGWGDYTTGEGIQPNVWAVDELTYYDTADEAFGGPLVPWVSTFDADADGVVEIIDQNPDKEILGTVADGRLPVHLWDVDDEDPIPPAYRPDKAGRLVGGNALTAEDSFSGVSEFVWSDMWGNTTYQAGSSCWHIFGFLGDTPYQTRQVCGALIRQWQIANGQYYIRINTFVGGATDDTRSDSQNSVSLGTDAEGKRYSVAVGWEPNTHTIRVELRNNVGAVIASTTTVVDDPVIIDSMQLSFLGWMDYTTGSTIVETQTTEMQIDRLSFFTSYEDTYPPPPSPGKLWEATFDTAGDFDGFINIFDKSQFDPPGVGPILSTNGAAGGKLEVTTYDPDLFGYVGNVNRAGRYVQPGFQIVEADSWSALYEFQWSDLAAYFFNTEGDVLQQLEIVGLLGYRDAWTRQMAGALLNHWKDADTPDGDLWLRLRAYMGGSNEMLRQDPGTLVNLTTNGGGENTDYQLAVGYDSVSDTLAVALYAADGTELASEAMVTTGADPTVLDYDLRWVGWGDFNVRGDNLEGIQTTTWDVDTVTFWYGFPLAAFDTAQGIPPGDIDGDGDVDVDDYLLWEACLAGPDQPNPGCPTEDFIRSDMEGDQDVDEGDFARFQEAFTG